MVRAGVLVGGPVRLRDRRLAPVGDSTAGAQL